MNKHFFVVAAVAFLFFLSCNEDRINRSGINVSESDDFGIVSIQGGKNGEVFCIGHPIKNDSTVVKRYDRNLQLLESINLSRRLKFNGRLTLTIVPNKGWIICDSEMLPDSSKVTVYFTDENFLIQKQRVIHSSARLFQNFSGQIFDVQVMQNGDYLLAWDTSQVSIASGGYLHDDFGLRISRLDQNLESVFEYKCGNSGIDSTIEEKGNPRAIELEDGSIFFLYNISGDIQNSPNSVSGLLEANGKLVYQKAEVKEFDWVSTNSLSRSENGVIHSFVANNELINFFDLIDPKTGTIIKRARIPYNYNISSIWGYGEINNRLPRVVTYASGYVSYLEDRQKLYFMSLDPNLLIKEKFEIPLPNGMKTNSFRQLFTSKGTVIVGASIYEGNKQNRSFVLLEMTLDGEILQ